jgi:hypothetical protein
MTTTPSHRRTAHLKDWDPGFQSEVTALYRAGLDDLAAEAERVGHVQPMPRIPRLGAILRAVLARAHAARFRNQP